MGEPVRRLYVLLAYDPATGCATRPVAVAGVEGAASAVSWVPLEHLAAEGWRTRIAGLGDAPLVGPLRRWEATADGISVDLALLPSSDLDLDLVGAVEAAVADLLAAVGGR